MHRRFLSRIASASFFLLGVFCFSIACEHEQASAPVPLQPTFSSIQDNIFTLKCVNRGCHPGGNAPMPLTKGQAYANLVGVNSGYGSPQRLLRVQPNDADNSVLYLKIIGDPSLGGAANRMPLGFSALSSEEIAAIQTWINNGAQNN